MCMDTDNLRILHLGPLTGTLPYEQAVSHVHERIASLPPADLVLAITVNGRRYHCTGGARPRLVESGRFVQRGDITGLTFADDAGKPFTAEARLEITAWPQTLSILLETNLLADWHDAAVEIALNYAGRHFTAKRTASAATTPRAGEKLSAAITLQPVQPTVEIGQAPAGVSLEAVDRVDGKASAIRWADGNAWFTIDLNRSHPIAARNDFIDSALVKIRNAGDREQVVPLCFDQNPARAVVGMMPVLRQPDGTPTGIPVQISKDWHGLAEGKPYNGCWLHAFTLLRLAPHATAEYRLDVAHAYWGRLPAVSHAQLCLLGYGGDQQWDQVAIGSWGESICYDPDVNLGRSMIDDIRPLLVKGSAGIEWSWTNNVGGGDFLVYDDARGRRQRLVDMKTAFLRYGPVFTEAVYAGMSADRAIAARITARTCRAGDFPRHFHLLRYDVIKPLRFRRLAFYQAGADRYNGNWFHRMARGDAAGMREEWEIKRASGAYDRTRIAAPGPGAWFSLHDVDPVVEKPVGSGGASRGLLMHSWKARLGGKEQRMPFFSVFGAEPSAILELAAPPSVSELLPGDFVAAELEYIVLPAVASDYYGPDPDFRAALDAGANTWRPVYCEATAIAALDLKATTGQLKAAFPPEVAAQDDRAEFTLGGAAPYVPVTISALRRCRDPRFEFLDASGLWQSVDSSGRANDSWQTDYDAVSGTWACTYTVPPHCFPARAAPHRFRFRFGSAAER
jgi:hypothetical protein